VFASMGALFSFLAGLLALGGSIVGSRPANGVSLASTVSWPQGLRSTFTSSATSLMAASAPRPRSRSLHS
jgi:hypothetical protein